MANGNCSSIDKALGLIPSGQYVLTAAFDHSRCGVLVKWVQRCSVSPPMVMVALPLGQRVEPLIRDSRSFALCQLAADDRFTQRKLAGTGESEDDLLVAMVRLSAPSGSPVIDRAVSYLDCELARHIDIEADCALYVGLVRHAAVLNPEHSPAVFVGLNGATATSRDVRLLNSRGAPAATPPRAGSPDQKTPQ
jgi:flavin reductase (DIM6/NTAB) family NADH-FMN oxidoreductase RutF